MATATIIEPAPGPSGRLLIGCLGEFRNDPIGLMLRATRQHGDLVQFKIGPVLAHLVNHPDYIEHVLVKNARNYDKQTRSVAKIRATCGQSLLSTTGEAWRRHRQLIQPAFEPESVGKFVHVIALSTEQMLDRWSEAARRGRRLDIVSEMMQVTLTIAARSLFGADIERDSPVVERSLAVVLADTWRRLQNWFDPASLNPAFHRRAFRDARQSIDEVVFRMIRARRRHSGEPNDLLSILIRARDEDHETQLSDQELRDACVTLLLAGHETTANALASSCRLIAESPQVEARLREEAKSVLRGRTPVLTDVEMLGYTGNTFAEAIRLYPSIWIMERRVVGEDHIAGYRLPAGSTLLISPYVLHRHPEFWPDPEAFEPDRFAPDRFASDRSSTRPKYSYLPFGAGPHQCVGRHMATLVGQLILAMVFRRFRLQPVVNRRFPPQPGITLRHSQPLEMTVVENEI